MKQKAQDETLAKEAFSGKMLHSVSDKIPITSINRLNAEKKAWAITQQLIPCNMSRRGID